MSTNEAAVRALIEAQERLDTAEKNARIQAITMTPSNVLDLNKWRDDYVDPTNNPTVRAALEKRNQCLESLGLTVEEWLKTYKTPKSRLRG